MAGIEQPEWSASLIRNVRRVRRNPEVRWAARRLTAGARVVPDFIIAGAQKAGTTSMYHWLAAHPDVVPAFADEVHYFDRQPDRPLGWYRAHFPTRRQLSARSSARKVTGESSPVYLFYPWVPDRLAATLPDARVLILLRNPVDRAYSQYWMNKSLDREDLSFEEALDAEADRLAAGPGQPGEPRTINFGRYAYQARGRYAEQLERWFSAVGRDRILVLLTEEVAADPGTAYSEVLAFLGLDHFAPSFHARNVGEYEPMAPHLRRRLEDEFAPHNERVSALLGRPVPW